MLNDMQKRFVYHFLVTSSPEGSAIKAGYPREDAPYIAIDLLNNDEIIEAIKELEQKMLKALEVNKMTKERLLLVMNFNYEQALKRNDTRTAIELAEKIAKWQGVEPDKVTMEPVKLIINNLNDELI